VGNGCFWAIPPTSLTLVSPLAFQWGIEAITAVYRSYTFETIERYGNKAASLAWEQVKNDRKLASLFESIPFGSRQVTVVSGNLFKRNSHLRSSIPAVAKPFGSTKRKLRIAEGRIHVTCHFESSFKSSRCQTVRRNGRREQILKSMMMTDAGNRRKRSR
jgi:hypothetical protein